MEKLLTVLFFSGADKALVEYLSTIFTNWQTLQKRLASIIIGQVFAWCWWLDAFALVGYEANIKYIGIFLTGILIAGGSNLIYDIFNPENKTILVDKEETIADELEKG